MNKVFDFSERDKSENTIIKTWDDFRNSLAIGKFSFNQLDLALKETFLKVFNDMFSINNTRMYFTTSITNLISLRLKFCRGAKIAYNEKVDYNRFIPNAHYITEDNRFSPPRVEWLYLAMQESSKTSSSSVEECCIKECHAQSGDKFALCSFKLNDAFKGENIVDLTISNDYTYDGLNDALEKYGQKYKTRCVNDFLFSNKPLDFRKEELKEEIKKWAAFTYAKLMSEQLFIPLNTSDKKLTYSPFQCLAQYFISKGYKGIIYSSTVCQKAKNIVLFDKQLAKPVGYIKEIII